MGCWTRTSWWPAEGSIDVRRRMFLTLGEDLVALAVEEETGPWGKDCVESIAEVSMRKGKLLRPLVKAAASSSALCSHGPCKTTAIKPITLQHCTGLDKFWETKFIDSVPLSLGQGHQLFALNTMVVIILQSFKHLSHTHTHRQNRLTLKTMPWVTWQTVIIHWLAIFYLSWQICNQTKTYLLQTQPGWVTLLTPWHRITRHARQIYKHKHRSLICKWWTKQICSFFPTKCFEVLFLLI